MKWNLKEILEVKDFDKLSQEIEKDLEKLKIWVKKLSPKMSREDFEKMLRLEEEMRVKMSRLAYLPHLMEAVNQKDQQAKVLSKKAEDLGLKISQTSTKIGLWIQGKIEPQLDDKNAKRLFGVIKDLEYSLQRSREGAKFSLNEKEEEIIRHKDSNGVGVIGDLRRMIETEFEYKLGKKKIKSQAELLSLVHSPESKFREDAYRALLETQKKNIDKFFAMYQAIVRDWAYEAKLRGYQSPISVRNWGNDVPDKAVESLLSVCTEEKGVFWNYFKWKAKRLGVKKLKRFDIYAPMAKKDKKISYEEAVEVVLESFKEFSSEFWEAAREIVEKKHIDVYPSPAKIGGAFCATVEPKINPYIMLNFTGKTRDISTLAHELGHGVHSILANKHLASVQQSGLPLAETASTLAELVVFEKMMAQEKDKELKKAWLSEKIADAYASICRQNYFVKFEIEAHEKMSQGLSPEDLSKIYLKNLKEQFGDSVAIDPLFAYEWSYVSHLFESPFYCYAYNFGELLSYNLYRKYQKDKGFLKKIIKILATGGSEKPSKILATVGVDIEKKEFWRESFKVIKRWQKELAEL